MGEKFTESKPVGDALCVREGAGEPRLVLKRSGRPQSITPPRRSSVCQSVCGTATHISHSLGVELDF
jgi:hypothetical protein